jgi:hypothetical protein
MGRDKLRAYEASQAKLREAALARAEALVAEGRFDDAERAVLEQDRSSQGPVALAKLFERRLEQLVGEGAIERDRGGVEEVFLRARTWSWRQYPEPHTAQEAFDRGSWCNEDTARLVKILGYEVPWPSTT